MSGDALPTKNTDFVMLRRYRDLPEAVIAKSILDAEGIDSVLGDENLVRMDWFWFNLLGGVKLWVRLQDLENAQELIDQRSLENFDVEGVGAFSQPHCPQCQSIDISFRALNKRVAFVSAYFGLPIPLKRRGWKCHTCGHSWQDPGENERAADSPD